MQEITFIVPLPIFKVENLYCGIAFLKFRILTCMAFNYVKLTVALGPGVQNMTNYVKPELCNAL